MRTFIVSITDSKQDIDNFIDKFGQKSYDTFLKLKDRLKNNGISTDLTWHTKNTTPSDMDTLLNQLQNRVARNGNGTSHNNIKKIYQDNRYRVIQVLDWQTAMNLGVNAVWCIGGRYGSGGSLRSEPVPKDAKFYFEKYLNDGNYVAYLYVYDKEYSSNEPLYCICPKPNEEYDIWDRRDNIKESIPNLYITYNDGNISFSNEKPKDTSDISEMTWEDIVEHIDEIKSMQYKYEQSIDAKIVYIGNRRWVIVYQSLQLQMYSDEHFDHVFEYNKGTQIYNWNNGYKVSYEESDMYTTYLPQLQSKLPSEIRNIMTSDLELLEEDELKKISRYFDENIYWYWSKSPNYSSSDNFCFVSSGGSAGSINASNFCGVAACFAM